MERLSCICREVDFNCGLGVVGNFDTTYSLNTAQQITSRFTSYGTGFFVSGFVDDEACKRAYKFLTLRFKLVYQSPVRKNTNSDNDFFFCIFDVKD